jgi:hypothetical protein
MADQVLPDMDPDYYHSFCEGQFIRERMKEW